MPRALRLTPVNWMLAIILGLCAIARADEAPNQDAPLPEAFHKEAPRTLADLRAIQERIATLSDKIRQATVAVQVGGAQGSGVIVSEDGYVLTAAHVCGTTDRPATFILPDGTKLSGRTLGGDRTVDAGMMKIETNRKLPHLSIANSEKLKLGDWCIAVGHPGGYQEGRRPVLRLGRVIRKQKDVIQTDCTLVGGDSGGPLLDVNGRVIGIHSRIGPSLSWNFHVPASVYQANWKTLAQVATVPSSRGKRPVLGVSGEDHDRGMKVTDLPAGYPAKLAGLRIGDVITRIGDQEVDGLSELVKIVNDHAPGDELRLMLLRGMELVEVTVELGGRD